VAAEQGGQRLLRLGLDDLHPQPRVCRERGEHGRQQGQRRGLERGDPHGAGRLVAERRQPRLGLFQPGEHGLRVLGEPQPGRGEPDAPPDPLDQPGARLRLEHGELLGHRGRAEVQCLRHRRDRPAPVQLVQQA
jgi:hypothetical protein